VVAVLAILLLTFVYDKRSKAMLSLVVFFSTPVFLMTFTGTVWSAMEYFCTKTPPQTWIEQELQRCTRNNTMSRTP